jgi:hypothetical protein
MPNARLDVEHADLPRREHTLADLAKGGVGIGKLPYERRGLSDCHADLLDTGCHLRRGQGQARGTVLVQKLAAAPYLFPQIVRPGRSFS